MFDLGMSELLVIGIVALIVIGPKDLPGLFRSLGKFTAKMRVMARDFSRAMEAAADESGVKDVAKDLRSVTSAKSMGLDAIKEATDKFEKWDPLKSTAKTTAHSAAKPDAGEASTTGPATQALAEAQAARKAVAEEAAAALARTAPERMAPEPISLDAEIRPTPDSSPKADA
ncbi:MAG: twin-arginine translocase subunit TatB [Rhodobacteraceae bacterium]|nr:twin-arginine translocase subunit TatB [Paracoccaceae bacterium]